MNIVNVFKEHFGSFVSTTDDFSLIEYSKSILVGVDKALNVVVVVKSDQKRFPLIQKTKNMSIECNVNVTYSINGKRESGIVHILRCLSENEKEKELFLELASVMIPDEEITENSIMESFSMLRGFFNNNKEVSDTELIGLYAELYTICDFHDELNLENYWQSRDKMKFDFSITEKLKLEIKATTKNIRTHHFRHEQLMTEVYDIYVMSYLLRYDDEGLSLYDLIVESKNYLSYDPRKLLKVDLVLKNVSEDRLKSLRFNDDYTRANMHFYNANKIPKFNESTPNGVANAEYDCVLDNISWEDPCNVCQIIKERLKAEEDI